MARGRSAQGGKRSGKAGRAHEAARLAPQSDLPASAIASGLFDPSLEKDSCGVGFIADIKGRHSHQIVKDGLTILLNLEHRGAVGADPRAGDGAGILVQTPHKFFVQMREGIGICLAGTRPIRRRLFVHAARHGMARERFTRFTRSKSRSKA